MSDLRIQFILLASLVAVPVSAQLLPSPAPSPTAAPTPVPSGAPAPSATPSPSPQPQETEAPEALFQQQIGDVGVELDAEGTWTTHMAAGWGAGFTPQGTLPGLGYPGFDKQPVFEQIPDFSLTLWLLKRYYLEVNYHEPTNDESFLLGYQGQPGELLQWVKIGNASFGVPERAGDKLADGRPGAPAAGAAFTLGPVSWETLVRYEDGSRETHTYRGYNDVTQSNVALDTWIRGRFFRLPGGTTAGIRILIEDPSGPYGGFRDVVSGEAVIDSTGEIRLPAAAKRRYLVTWTGAPATIGPTTLLKLTASPVSSTNIPGLPSTSSYWYLLTAPGTSTVFELRNRYPVAAGVTGQIRLYDNDSGLPVAGWPITQSPDNDWFEVSGAEEAPFASANDYAFEGIYPYADQGVPPVSTKVIGWAFHLPQTTTATSYSLGTDVIASSIIVERNGITTTAWKYDQAAGTLTFDTPVFETDSVVISFQRQKTANAASDLVTWQGGRWDISDKQNLEWNIQTRWNLSTDQTTTEDLQSPGLIQGTVAWAGTQGEWSWNLKGTGGALKSDSTGHRILYGQDNSGVQAVIDGDALRPSAAPLDSLSSISNSSFTLMGLNENNRGIVYFRNYWSNDPLTGDAVAGIWGTSGVSQVAPAADGFMGPYIVSGDGISTDRLAVLETKLTSNQWSAMQVFTDKGHADDLRSTSAISINIRVPDTTSTGASLNDRIFLQAGALSTDFDGTHADRAVAYRSEPALPFFNQDLSPSAATQYFPIPEGSSWGNDPSSTGSTVPDGSLANYELTNSGGLNLSNAGWQTIRLTLTDADRQKLQAATGWRIVVYSASGTSRTVLVGNVVFEGSTWSVVPSTTGTASTVTVSPAEVTTGSSQQLIVNWSNSVTTSPPTVWTIQGRHSPMRPLSYGTIEFTYQVSTPTTMTVKLSDYQGHGLTATWLAAASSGPVQALIPIRGKTVKIGGTQMGSVSLSSGALLDSWDRMTITSSSAATTGSMTVSEVEAVDPLWEPIGTTTATATWTQGAAWPSASFPLVSGMTMGFTSQQEGVTAETYSWTGQTTWDGSVGPIRTSGLASYAATPTGDTTHGEYQATLPIAWQDGPSVALTDQFSDQGLRSEHAVVSVPLLGTFDTLVKASGPPLSLDQDYRAAWSSLWPNDWAGSLSAEWTQSRPFDGTVGDFGEQWAASWGWLTPEADVAPYYLLQSQATMKTPFLFGPLDATLRGQVTQSSATTTTWTPLASWQLRETMRFANAGWSLTPSLSRQVTAVFDRSPVDPQTSAATAAAWLWSQPDGLFGLPFGESSSSASPWSQAPEGLDSGALSTAAHLDWSRDTKQDWTDIAVPHSGGVDYTTTNGIDGLAEYRSWEVGGHLEAQGLNLFGNQGSEPAFLWYRTDVWTWTASGSWQTGTRVQDQAAQLAAAVRSELVLSSQESLTLPASYQGTWGATPAQTWTVQPTWSLKQPTELPFDLPRWLSPRDFRRQWIQEISTTLTFGWTPDDSPPLKNLQISWKGRFLLSDKSEIDFTTQWGQQWQTNLTVVGLEASIDLILSF